MIIVSLDELKASDIRIETLLNKGKLNG